MVAGVEVHSHLSGFFTLGFTRRCFACWTDFMAVYIANSYAAWNVERAWVGVWTVRG